MQDKPGHGLGALASAGALWAASAFAAPLAVAQSFDSTGFIQLAGSPSNSYVYNTSHIDPTLEPRLDQAAIAYKQIATVDIAGLVDSAEKMLAAIKANDVPNARQAWIDARVYFDRSLIFTYMHRDILLQIDDWPQATEGFHGVEAGLFTPGAPLPVAEAERLVELLQRLQRVFTPEPLSAHEILVGMGIMSLALNSDRPLQDQSSISGTSLQDMRQNVEGIEVAWNTVYANIMHEKNKGLAERVEGRIAAVKQLLAVSSLLELDQHAFTIQTKLMEDSFSDVAVDIGWRQPDFADTD